MLPLKCDSSKLSYVIKGLPTKLITSNKQEQSFSCCYSAAATFVHFVYFGSFPLLLPPVVHPFFV